MNQAYSVTERAGCRILSGAMPISDLTFHARIMGKGAMLDTDLARILSASFVIGQPDNLQQLRCDPEVTGPALARVIAKYPNLSIDAARWYALGERGNSSDALFYALTGVGKPSRAHPRDISDLCRCIKLFDAVPSLAPKIGTAASISLVWGQLIDHWQELCELINSGDDGRSEAYALMKTIGCQNNYE